MPYRATKAVNAHQRLLYNLSNLPELGDEVEIELTHEELNQLNSDLGLHGINYVKAKIIIEPKKGAIQKISGNVKAEIIQECVISLETFSNEIEETIQLEYASQSYVSKLKQEQEDTAEEHKIDLPDIIEGDELHLLPIIQEFTALGIDPYPKKPGVVFKDYIEDAPNDNEEDEATSNPFSVLKSIKTN